MGRDYHKELSLLPLVMTFLRGHLSQDLSTAISALGTANVPIDILHPTVVSLVFIRVHAL